jgi:curved DNA-binding protein CbpA
VLGVTRESSKSEIGKAYRSLARKHHPDKHQDPEAKVEAEKRFQLLATA